MPIIGIIDSAKTGRLVTSSYFSIATQTASNTTTTTLTFTSIPQTYKHLQLVMFDGSNSISSAGFMYINNDLTNSNYYVNYYYAASASGTTSLGTGGTANPYTPNFTGGALTQFPGTMIMTIPDYTSTTKAKSALFSDGYYGSDTTYGGYMNHSGYVYTANTNAITRLDFVAPATYWKQDSYVALYGMA